MAAASTDFFTEVGNPGTATTLAAPGHTIGGSTFNVVSTSNYPTNTGVVFAVDTFTIQTVNGVATAVRTPGSYSEWEGTVTNSTTLSNAVLRYGTDQNYAAGSNTRIYIPVASSRENRLVQGIQLFANQDGSLKTAPVLAAIGAGQLNGYTPLGQVPTSVTYNGNRSYTMVLPTDLTGIVSNGMRLRTTRTVAAPTQCTSLNGTSQYYSKTAPAGMTFTDDFVVSALVKLTAYSTSNQLILSRYNGTSGWKFQISPTGQVQLVGVNGGAGNFSAVTSYQSLPLNKWVHLSTQLDMSTFTPTPTTSYVMFDGVDVPAQVTRGGTNPTALVQAGNLEVGSASATEFFTGKIAQAAVFNSKVTQTTIQSYISQGLLGTETSLISAYSFNNSINDLNTTNANNLTANGGAVATNADSPFTQDDTGTPSGTNDFAIVTKKVFSTNTTLTVQVPEGCTIPTIGGVSAVVYSSNKVPYGFPSQRGRWTVYSMAKTLLSTPSLVTLAWGTTNFTLTVPIGSWNLGYQGGFQLNPVSGGQSAYLVTLSTNTTADTDPELSLEAQLNGPATLLAYESSISKYRFLELSAATPYNINIKNNTAVTATGFIRGDNGIVVISAENAYI